MCDIENFNFRSLEMFIDLLHNDKNFPQNTIYDEISTADALVILRSPLVFTSPWVTWELGIALMLNKPILVVPLLRKLAGRTVANLIEQAALPNAPKTPF